MTPSSQRIEYLDSIRGLAAISVVFSHFILAYGLPVRSPLAEEILTNSPLHFWWDGFAAVALFFVLSGFVLTLKIFQGREPADKVLKNMNYLQYLIGRICRIWLPYIFCFFLNLYFIFYTQAPSADSLILEPSQWVLDFWSRPLSKSLLLREFLLFLPVPNYEVNPPAWSLHVELVLSFFIPAVALVAARSIFWLIFLVLLAVAVLKVYFYAVLFVMGIVLAKYVNKLQSWSPGNRRIQIFLFSLGAFFYTFRFTVPVYFPNLVAGQRIFYFAGLGALLLLAFVLRSPMVQKVLLSPFFLLVGKTSYGIYLVHYFVLLRITPWSLHWYKSLGFNGYTAAWYLGAFVTVGCTLLLSYVFYHLIEAPSIRLGKWMAQKVTSIFTFSLL